MKKVITTSLMICLTLGVMGQTVKDTVVVETEQFKVIKEGMDRIVRTLAMIENRNLNDSVDETGLQTVEIIRQQAYPIMVQMVQQLAPQYLDTLIVDVQVDKYELQNELDIVNQAIFKWDNSLLVDDKIKEKKLSEYKQRKKKIEKYLLQVE
jgi:hypothetical protein